MRLINRYIILLFLSLCSIFAFSQGKKQIEVIHIPYADTISQELLDYIDSRTEPYMLMYHPDMAHLIPEMKCRRPNIPAKRIGVFSVAKDRQVSFSQGNLQYIQSANHWRFADNQYDYIGADNVKDGKLADRIDLFGWSGKDSKAPFGISTSTDPADYAGEFLDWGTNVIQGDAAGTWRTLSREEWEYIYFHRKNAANLFGLATINGISGMILLPDDWQQPEGIVFVPSTTNGLSLSSYTSGAKKGLVYFHNSNKVNHFNDNVYTLEQWSKLEKSNAVFLPAAGYLNESKNWKMRIGDPVSDLVGSYVTSTLNSSTTCSFMRFCDQEVCHYVHYFHRGRSVRLVHDTIVPSPAPCRTIEVNGVTFNMMCVEGGIFMMGATEEQLPYAKANEKPVHQVTVSDFMMSQTEVTQELWKAVMGTTIREHHAANPSTSSIAGVGDTHPMYMINKDDCQVFIQKLNELTGLHFRMPTEAEWEYAARGGRKSRGFIYSGSDNMDEVAWHLGNSGNKTHPVAQKQPNELGLYDMSGNVWEWVSDWASNYTVDAQVNPIGPATGNYYVIRGGSRGWSEHNMTRVSARKTDKKIGENDRSFIGLRLVLDENKVEVRLSYDEGREKLGKNKE